MAERLEDIRERVQAVLAADHRRTHAVDRVWADDASYLLGEVTRLQQKLDASIAAALDTQRRLDTELLEEREQVHLWKACAEAWEAHAEGDHARVEEIRAGLAIQGFAEAAGMDGPADQVEAPDTGYGLQRAADGLDKLLGGEATYPTAETIRYTADVALLTQDGRVLLIERKHEPYAGQWAFPGGHVDSGETSLAAAVRELAEETGVRLALQDLRQRGTYDTPGRDPRGRYVTVVYSATLSEPIEPTAGDDAKQARWWPLNELPPLAFDHYDILANVVGIRHGGPADQD